MLNKSVLLELRQSKEYNFSWTVVVQCSNVVLQHENKRQHLKGILIVLSSGEKGSAMYFRRGYIVLDLLPLRMEKRKQICLIRPLPLHMYIGFYIKAFNSYTHIRVEAIVRPCDGLRSRMLMLSKGTLFNVYCNCINRVTRAKWDVNDL